MHSWAIVGSRGMLPQDISAIPAYLSQDISAKPMTMSNVSAVAFVLAFALHAVFHCLSHMCHESGLLIGSQQVSFFRTNLLFPNLPAFLFIDKTGFLIGYKNPNLPACCLRCRPPQTAQQQWRTKFS